MPTEHIRFSYKFSELDEAAQQKAVETIADKLSGDWWDDSDRERIAETLVATLAWELKSPGFDTFGVSDFPGITGLSLVTWQVEHDPYIGVTGTLDRDNAPGLPWPDQAAAVDLKGFGHGTRVTVEAIESLPFTCTQCAQQAERLTAYDDVTYHVTVTGDEDTERDENHRAVSSKGLSTVDKASLDRFEQTVRDALSTALEAGNKEAEYTRSEESAREWIDSNEPDFNEDGTLF